MSPRRAVYSRKAHWKARFKTADKKILELLNLERSGALEIPVSDYFTVGYELVKLGELGEDILRETVKFGMEDRVIRDLRDSLNMVHMFSERLKKVAESKWGNELVHFPQYKTSVAAFGELSEEAAAIREMNEMLEGDQR